MAGGGATLSRRDVLRLCAVGGACALTACDPARVVRRLPVLGTYVDGRLTARPAAPTVQPPERGRTDLRVEGHRVLLSVPATAGARRPMPFALLLHGASGRAEGGFRMWAPYAERAGVVLLAPDSNEGGAWDAMLGGFGPDVAMIDQLLAWAFERFTVDPARLAIGGFSNGATYALSLGLTNGDLFSHVVALSPGFMVPGKLHGRPDVFVAHGTRDRVLPIDRASRVIVPRLRRLGYDVTYEEFDAGHTLEPGIARDALRWFLRGRA